ncbi:MAG: hypothetical protein PUC77_06250 [Bacteroidales bacterium]|nr:hypothetical protein [Bacteroidales bacterium]MDD6141128.1 hypothetical protein [Bacteroidales bacterium]MDD6622910.1 hypothetical protein [Bacteroidales bacterium]MDD6669021.1 hypothetical protein [Bacteroidales bacterium]
MKANVDINYWRNLAERYFEAETTEAEETALRRFLATEAATAEFDDLRAVMGFAVVGRRRVARRHRRRTAIRWAAAAAVVAVIVAMPFAMSNSNEVYVAYVGGEKITDRDEVVNQMHSAMAQVLTDDGDSFESQMDDIFNTLNNK